MRTCFLSSLWLATTFSFASTGLAAETPADFRKAQRAEFASLPRVADPKTTSGENPIDALFKTWRERTKTPDRPACSDAILIRRISFDVVGLPPSPEDVEAFVTDRDPKKAEHLVASLLRDTTGYAEHWMTFWNDALRNDEQTAIDGLRKPITSWLHDALKADMPYDRMVAELLDPVGPNGPDGYLKGVNWRGRVNLSQRPPVQAAQNVAQVFLATSIRCASCHDGFTTAWKLKDAYGLASFFSESQLELARCDKPTGEFMPPKFLYPGLGDVRPDAPLTERRAAVASMVTRPKNARFAKVIVNRLWDRLMGEPLAEPIDEMAEPNCPEIIDWLAYDFMRNDYDLKHTLELIHTSNVYRRRSAEPAEDDDPTIELGPVPRRLSGEQFLDALASLTGFWPKYDPLVNLKPDGPHVRAWRQKRPNEFVIALGRPNREQVVTRRIQDATVLQALEATNGSTLTRIIASGADALLASPPGSETDPTKVVNALFRRAYARSATAEEIKLLTPTIGKPSDPRTTRKAGLEDLLWIIVNSPEFQVIR